MLVKGQKLGPFVVERELGSGAMGTVFRAVYTKTGQRVAIKVIAPGLGSNETALARFEREMNVLKQLKHPNIVRLYATGRYHKAPFYAMEYIEGESLDRVLARRGRFTWEEVVEIGKQLCAALQHAHQQGIIHRDLKPSNLMVLADGSLKLTDFGIAKDLDVTQLTGANCTVGTAAYMSPEQCKGERNLTHKSDLYSMGILFYELLTGRKPFQAETTMDMFLLHVNAQPERPSKVRTTQRGEVIDVPVWLDTLVMQLLEKPTDRRPFDASMVAESLERVREKVEAQQSAGADAAKARRADLPLSDAPVDETDRDAARTLAAGKKRKKRKKKPLVKQRWAQAVGLGTLLLAVIGVVVWSFLPASADKLFQQAQKLMASADSEDHFKARDKPIREYLARFGERRDDQASQVRAWADEYDLAQREVQLATRMRHDREPTNDAERLAPAAVRDEEAGNWQAAAQKWEQLEQYRDSADPDLRPWGLLATKRLRELREAAGLEKQLWEQVAKTRARGSAGPPAQTEELAVEALRYEDFGDMAEAHKRWQVVKTRASGTRALVLLAVRKLKDLKDKVPPEKEIDSTRLKLVRDILSEAAKAVQPQRRAYCQEVIALYERFDELKQEVDRAKKLLARPTDGAEEEKN